MILKEFYLYPDLVEYSNEVTYPFRDQSRCICNYLERQIKRLKFKTNGFKRICIKGKLSPDNDCFINSSNVLTVEVCFDEDKYKTLSEDKLNDYFIDMLHEGFKKCKKQFDIPLVELTSHIEQFCLNEYVNEWIFKTKQIKDYGIKCILKCNLTLSAFHLNLLIYKGKNLILEKEILSTEPDEIVFVPLFKDFKMEKGKLVVIDKFGDSVYEQDITSLG